MTDNHKAFYPGKFLAPSHWPMWCLLALLWMLAKLPWRMQLSIGRRLGDGMYHIHPARRNITTVNINLCFPEKTAEQKYQLVRDAYRAFGISIMEMASLWFRKPEFLLQHCDFSGLEFIKKAKAQGKGVILLQAHFTTLELGAYLLSTQTPMDANFDTPKNKLFAAFLLSKRARSVETMIDNKNIRQMVRSLRDENCVWYSPDQHVSEGNGGIVSHFMGQKVLTVAGASRMAKMTGAVVLPFLPTRDARYRYQLRIFPALENFPGDSLVQDTQRINDILESHIRNHIDQYFWLHKRFKSIDSTQTDPYK